MKHTFYFFLISVCLFTSCSDDSINSFDSGGGGVLQGSLNRFSVSGDYLYVINNTQLIPYNISSPSSPTQETAIEVGVGIETVITKGNNLFIGANDGMYIFDISNRANPILLSVYDHVLSCDPVAVQGNYAYVTLRTSSECRQGSNVLDVVDISDLRNPRLVSSTPMENPHGLGVEGEELFVTEGIYGLKHFSVVDPSFPQIKKHLQNIPHNVDVIPVDNVNYNDILIVTGAEGIYQYDYSSGSLNQISQLSFQ